MIDPKLPTQDELKKMEAMLQAAAEAIAAEMIELRQRLSDLDLIGPDNPGKPRVETSQIEADHLDGPRLYGLDGDTVVATRLREDGRYEHSTLDEHGQPIEWRTVYRPELN